MGVSYHCHLSFLNGGELPWPPFYLQWAGIISTFSFSKWAGVTSTVFLFTMGWSYQHVFLFTMGWSYQNDFLFCNGLELPLAAQVSPCHNFHKLAPEIATLLQTLHRDTEPPV
jgi:hypothetical protein